MSNAELTVLADSADPVSLAISDLTLETFRTDGVCPEQVARLAELGGSWPPILVRRDDNVVIDGAHRIAAAQRLGLARIAVTFFEGDSEAGFVEFVRRNVSQGLALTVDERKRAARRILRSHPIWSDRRVAELCVLSPKTVSAVRVLVDADRGDQTPQRGIQMREGRDRRLRPVANGSARARAMSALRERPDASLREIASEASVSPETVRQARLHLVTDAAATPDIAPAAIVDETPPEDAEPQTDPWERDPALTSSECRKDFVAWFEQTAIADADLSRIESVPLSRVYVIADEARRRSEIWMTLARALEKRPSGRR